MRSAKQLLFPSPTLPFALSPNPKQPNPNPSPTMARIPKLEPAFEPADAFIGIATNMPVIQLVHFVNQQTLLNLVREEDLPVYSEKTDSLNYFKFFHYEDDDYRSDFCLLTNSNEGINMLPTHRQFSYFLVIHGAIPSEKVKQIMTQIKSIAGVQLPALVGQEPIKTLGPILQDLELHLTDLKTGKAWKKKRIMPSAENQ